MNFWCFDEQGNWFLRNDRGHFASRTYQTFDGLLNAVAADDNLGADEVLVTSEQATLGELLGDNAETFVEA